MRGEGSGRRQPAGSAAPGDGEPWECSMNPDEARNRCDIAEEVEGEALGSEDDLDEESEVEEAVEPQPDDDDDDTTTTTTTTTTCSRCWTEILWEAT